jgi:hypothetical protein
MVTSPVRTARFKWMIKIHNLGAQSSIKTAAAITRSIRLFSSHSLQKLDK